MNTVRERGEVIRRYILENLEDHPNEIARLTADHFGCTRQAVHKHLQRLLAEGAISVHGANKKKSYALVPLTRWSNTYPIGQGVTEDAVWLKDIAPFFAKYPVNVKAIWHYGFTEMFNNAIDHSGGSSIFVMLTKTASST